MLNFHQSLKTGVAAVLIAALGVVTAAPVVAAEGGRGENRREERRERETHFAQNRDNDRRDWNHGDGRRWDNARRDGRWDNRREWRQGRWQGHWRHDRRWDGPRRVIHYHPRPAYYRPYFVPRSRYYHNIRVYRPYGHTYPGFGFYYRDDDALRFLGLTALSLVIFKEFNEAQQRAHEAALVEATQADIGERIYWNDGGYEGAVTPVRAGEAVDGRPCREFQQEVIIGGRRTEAYGTVCMQPDGSWEVVND